MVEEITNSISCELIAIKVSEIRGMVRKITRYVRKITRYVRKITRHLRKITRLAKKILNTRNTVGYINGKSS